MKFYKNSNDNYVLGDKLISPKSSAYLQYSTDNSYVIFYYDNKVLLNENITDIQKEDNSYYVDRAELELALKDFFVDATAESGRIIEKLTETYIPMMGFEVLENSCLHETETELISSKTIVTPPGSVYIGRNAKLSNALRALNLSDEILNKKGLLLSQIYDESGSEPGFVYEIANQSELIVNQSESETRSYTQFIRTPQNDEIINAFYIKTTHPSFSTRVKIDIKLESFNGPIVYEIDENVITNSNGIAHIELGNPILTDNGLPLYIMFNIMDMYGLIDNEVFIPNHMVKIQLIKRKEIALKEDSYYPYIHLHRNQDLTIGNDTLLEFDNVEGFKHIYYNAGIFTFSEMGIYQVDFFCSVNVLATTDFIVWTEHSLDNGCTWLNNEHMIKVRLKSDGNNTIPLASVFTIQEGEQYRIKVKASTATTKLETQSLINSLGTIYQYAADLAMVKVSEL